MLFWGPPGPEDSCLSSQVYAGHCSVHGRPQTLLTLLFSTALLVAVVVAHSITRSHGSFYRCGSTIAVPGLVDPGGDVPIVSKRSPQFGSFCRLARQEGFAHRPSGSNFLATHSTRIDKIGPPPRPQQLHGYPSADREPVEQSQPDRIVSLLVILEQVLRYNFSSFLTSFRFRRLLGGLETCESPSALHRSPGHLEYTPLHRQRHNPGRTICYSRGSLDSRSCLARGSQE